MSTQNKPAVKQPPRLDLKKGEAVAKKVIRENKQWLKEMADK
jgi:hypothetical protein